MSISLRPSTRRPRRSLAGTSEIERRVLGPEDPQTLRGMNNLGLVYLYVGKYTLAEPLTTDLPKSTAASLVLSTPPRCQGLAQSATGYQSQGKYAQAEDLFSQVLEVYRRDPVPSIPTLFCAWATWPVRTPLNGQYRGGRGTLHQDCGDPRPYPRPEHPRTLSSRYSLGQTLFYEGKYSPAEALLSQITEIRKRVLGPEHPGPRYGRQAIRRIPTLPRGSTRSPRRSSTMIWRSSAAYGVLR